MPRSNWKGSISFGLVSIPIVLYNAVDSESKVSFRQINKKTGATIKYKRVDAKTGKEVAWEDIGKGYQYDKDVIIPVKEGELEKVAGENARTIAIEEFIDKKNIDYVHVEHTYYLTPGKNGTKGYIILREALKSANKIGIAKVIISTKEYLAAVSVYEDALVLYLLHYNDEMVHLDDLNIPQDELKKYKVTHNEIEVAKKLIQSMSKKWNPAKFKDEFREVLLKWIDKKSRNLPTKTMKARSQAKKAGANVDFITLLKKSLESTDKKKSAIPKAAKRALLKKKGSYIKRAVH